MRRALRTTGAVLAPLVFLALLVLAVRSFWRVDVLAVFTPAGKLQAVASWKGSAIFFFSDVPFGGEVGLTAQTASAPADDFAPTDDTLHDKPALKWKLGGFRLARGDFAFIRSSPRYTAVTVPQWLLLAAAAVPAWRTTRTQYLRRMRSRRGWCLSCGYDLRGTPGRCPECGATA